ncbi:MAG: hypothetical protein LBR25_05505, partial [Erysipelotrichaceae bacterium]|nr:hypothetical protein [Erysipelotrichaceae bacterium]
VSALMLVAPLKSAHSKKPMLNRILIVFFISNLLLFSIFFILAGASPNAAAALVLPLFRAN